MPVLSHGPGGGDVGEDVGAAEAVDGLFGVTDQIEGIACFTADALEDLPLQRVGILELVDQGGAIACAQASGQALSAGGGQCRVQVQQQVIEAAQVPAPFAAGEFRLHPIVQAGLPLDQLFLEGLFTLGDRVEHLLAEVEKRVRGERAGRRSALFDFSDAEELQFFAGLPRSLAVDPLGEVSPKRQRSGRGCSSSG